MTNNINRAASPNSRPAHSTSAPTATSELSAIDLSDSQVLSRVGRNQQADQMTAPAGTGNRLAELVEALNIQINDANDPKKPAATLSKPAAMLRKLFYGHRIKHANDPNTTTDMLRQLSDGDRIKHANNPNTTTDMLRQLVDGVAFKRLEDAVQTDVDVLIAVARHDNVSTHTLETIAYESLRLNKPDVLVEILKYVHFPESELEKLFLNDFPDKFLSSKAINLALASHPNMPAAMLDKLANHTDVDVLIAVARNSNTSGDAQEALAKRHLLPVDIALVFNKSTDAFVLEILFLRHEFRNEDIMLGLAKNPKTSAGILEWLAVNDFDKPYLKVPVRVGVASNKNTPQELRNILLGDENKGVVQMAKANDPDTTADELAVLLKAAHEGLAKIAKAHDPETNLEELCDGSIIYEDDESYLLLVFSVALHPNVTIDMLNSLVDHDDADIKAAAVYSLKTKSVQTPS